MDITDLTDLLQLSGGGVQDRSANYPPDASGFLFRAKSVWSKSAECLSRRICFRISSGSCRVSSLPRATGAAETSDSQGSWGREKSQAGNRSQPNRSPIWGRFRSRSATRRSLAGPESLVLAIITDRRNPRRKRTVDAYRVRTARPPTASRASTPPESPAESES